MLRAPVDSNVFVAGFGTSYENSANFQVIMAIFDLRFRLLTSDETMDELQRVLKDAKARIRHGKSAVEIDAFCERLSRESENVPTTPVVLPKTVRDVTDRKFVELAVAGNADYLVTNDHRHLGTLKKVGRIQVVTPRKFMKILERG